MPKAYAGIAIVFLTSILCFPILAQEPPSDLHQHTTEPTGARFEIVQSELAAKWTFRLDRFTGRVAQLVKTEEGDSKWAEMAIIGLPTLAQPSRPRFQIFLSGLAAKFSFLIDTETGKTWTLITGKRKNPDGTEYEEHYWDPFVG